MMTSATARAFAGDLASRNEITVLCGIYGRAHGSGHSQRIEIELKHGFFFLTLMVFFFAETDDGADSLAVETRTLKLCVNFGNILTDGLLFFFEAFNTLDEGTQLADSNCLGFRCNIVAHWLILIMVEGWLEDAASLMRERLEASQTYVTPLTPRLEQALTTLSQCSGAMLSRRLIWRAASYPQPTSRAKSEILPQLSIRSVMVFGVFIMQLSYITYDILASKIVHNER